MSQSEYSVLSFTLKWTTEALVQLHSRRDRVTFHSNNCGRRNEVTIETGYLRWVQGDPEALLHPLGQLDPESRGK